MKYVDAAEFLHQTFPHPSPCSTYQPAGISHIANHAIIGYAITSPANGSNITIIKSTSGVGRSCVGFFYFLIEPGILDRRYVFIYVSLPDGIWRITYNHSNVSQLLLPRTAAAIISQEIINKAVIFLLI